MMIIISLPRPLPLNPNAIQSNPLVSNFATPIFTPPLIPIRRHPLRTKSFKHDDDLLLSQKMEGFSCVPAEVPFEGENLWSNFGLYLFSLHVPMSFGGLSVVARFMNVTVLDPQIEGLSLLAIQTLELIIVFSLLNYTAKPDSEVFSFLKSGKFSEQRNWLLASAVGFVLLISFIFVISSIEDVLLGPKAENNPILKEILQYSDISRTACILAYCFITPLLEETVYRGCMLSTLASKTKWQYAVLTSSLVFSAGHFSIDNAVQLFVIGCVLGCSYCWTGRCWLLLELRVIWMAPEECIQGSIVSKEKHSSVEKWNVSNILAEVDDNSPNGFECNICLDFVQDPVVTFCGHLYCWPCIYKWIYLESLSADFSDEQPQCPVCRAKVSMTTLVPLYDRGNLEDASRNKKLHPDPRIPPRPRPPNSEKFMEFSYLNFSILRQSLVFMVNEMLHGRGFRSSSANYLAEDISPSVRRQIAQTEKLLRRMSYFLFCCIILCIMFL